MLFLWIRPVLVALEETGERPVGFEDYIARSGIETHPSPEYKVCCHGSTQSLSV